METPFMLMPIIGAAAVSLSAIPPLNACAGSVVLVAMRIGLL